MRKPIRLIHSNDVVIIQSDAAKPAVSIHFGRTFPDFSRFYSEMGNSLNLNIFIWEIMLRLSLRWRLRRQLRSRLRNYDVIIMNQPDWLTHAL